MKNTRILTGMVLIFALVLSAYAGCSGCSQAGNETVTIDLSPKAKILLPGDKEFYEGAQINFVGIFTGQDNCGSGCSYTWYSRKDGLIGNGLSIYRNNLSVGGHTIEFRYIDGAGQLWTAAKEITIKPVALYAKIASPKPEQLYRLEDNIPFEVSVKGGVPPYTYAWLLDGETINNKKYFEMRLAEGTHKVRLEVKDSADAYMTAERTLWVGKPADAVILPLKVSIKKPKEGQITKDGYMVQFDSSVSGGRGPYTYSWVSDVNRKISSEKAFYYANLTAGPNGTNTITLKVTDSTGFVASAKATMSVKPICNKDGICYTNEDYLNCPEDCPTGSADGICDKIKDETCDPDCKWQEDADCICNRNGLCDMGIENYANCPKDCISGSQDGICDKIDDGRCDPDCPPGKDANCSSGDNTKYFLLLLVGAFLVFIYFRFIRNR